MAAVAEVQKFLADKVQPVDLAEVVVMVEAQQVLVEQEILHQQLQIKDLLVVMLLGVVQLLEQVAEVVVPQRLGLMEMPQVMVEMEGQVLHQK
jgi:hypothetical protein